MKYIPNKSYGYPVQRESLTAFDKDNADYTGSDFSPQLHSGIDPDNHNQIFIEVEVLGLEPPIKAAIGKQQADIFLIVQCKNTFFSAKILLEHKDASKSIVNDEMKIDANKLFGEVNARVLVIAKDEFLLKSDKINPEFGYDKFSVERGMLLAESPTSVWYVNKEPKNNPKSIVTLNVLDTLKGGEYTIDLDNEYIEVGIGNDLNQKISLYKNTKGGASLNNNLLYVPVITFALTKLKDNDEYKEFKWGQVLTTALEELEFSNETMRSEPHNQAQALFRDIILTDIYDETKL
ncbi:hypothetical protein OAH94_06885 [Amylibacter sp.]|nr:hypothetical protein [Amylibacter sp.]